MDDIAGLSGWDYDWIVARLSCLATEDFIQPAAKLEANNKVSAVEKAQKDGLLKKNSRLANTVL